MFIKVIITLKFKILWSNKGGNKGADEHFRVSPKSAGPRSRLF